MMKSLRIAAALLLALASPALAGTGSTNYTSSGGTTFQTGTNGNSNNSATMNICDVAGTWTTVVGGCASVTALGTAGVTGLNVNAQIISPLGGASNNNDTAGVAIAATGVSASAVVLGTACPGAVGTIGWYSCMVSAMNAPINNQVAAPTGYGIGAVTGVYASNSALTNNYPVIAGCQYNSSLPSVTATYGVDNQCDSSGRQIVVGAGVAGTGAGGVMTVQGSASGTPVPVSGTVTTTPPSNASTNVAQINGNTTNTGTGASSTGTQRVVVSTDSPGGSASSLAYASADPCSYSKKSSAFFNITSSGASIITAVASQYVYICQISVSTTTITNFSLVAGTGSSVCTGGTPYALWGNPGVTAANGFQIGTATTAPGGGGVVIGNGGYTVAGGSVGGTVNYNVCPLITTTNSPTVNGTVLYVQTAS